VSTQASDTPNICRVLTKIGLENAVFQYHSLRQPELAFETVKDTERPWNNLNVEGAIKGHMEGHIIKERIL